MTKKREHLCLYRLGVEIVRKLSRRQVFGLCLMIVITLFLVSMYSISF